MIKEKTAKNGTSVPCVMHRKDPLYAASNALEQASERYYKSALLFVYLFDYLFVCLFIYLFIYLIIVFYTFFNSGLIFR